MPSPSEPPARPTSRVCASTRPPAAAPSCAQCARGGRLQTVAFEDLYPSVGDGDYNDLVVGLRSTEILNADKVCTEAEHYACDTTKVVCWDDVGHADCILSSDKWPEVKKIMLEQELAISRGQ